MNKVNFININADQNELTYKSWIKTSSISLVGLVILILVVQINQMIDLVKLKNEKEELESKLLNFDDTVKEKNRIKGYKNEVEKQLKTIQKRSSSDQAGLAYNLLSAIIEALPDNIYIESLDYSSKNGLSIKGCCAVLQEAVNFSKNLNNIKFIQDAKIEYIKFKDNVNLNSNNLENQFLHEFLITLKLKKE